MDEKVIEMLAKILEGQNELQNELKQEINVVSKKVDKLEKNLKQEINEVSTKVDKLENELKQEIKEVSTNVDKLEMRIEIEVVDRIKILFDARDVQNEAIVNIAETLNRVEAKLDVLQLETAHVRRIK